MRGAGAAFVIDGTQSIGALPFDVARIQPDLVVCAAYKWLLGPFGELERVGRRNFLVSEESAGYEFTPAAPVRHSAAGVFPLDIVKPTRRLRVRVPARSFRYGGRKT